MQQRLLFYLASFLLLSQCRRPERVERVEEVQLVTTDIDHFREAYAAAMRDTSEAYRVFQARYFARASPGLQDYYQRRYHGDARLFARRITRRPHYYASVDPALRAVADQKPRVLAAFRKLQQLYPRVRFNHVYFLVGGFAGSTAQPPGLLIGADQTVCGPGVDTSELTLVQRNRCGTVAYLPQLVTHELIHNVQQPHTGTLLSGAIREGMADFVAELATGSLGSSARLHTYGNAHERELWAAFRQEMNGSNVKNWLANSEQETPAKPCDLGYYVGYKICAAYYSRATNKQQALADILAADDFPALLRRSGYEATMTTR